MIHLYPFFSIGTVKLEQYNTMAYAEREEGVWRNDQTLGYGFGFGLGYDWKSFEIGTSLVMFVSPSTSEGEFSENGDVINYRFRHTLFNYLFNFHTGLNSKLSENFLIYIGIKPMFGFSNLKWFLKRWSGPYYYQLDASLSSSSFGMGFETRGEIYVSKHLSVFVNFGYDMIKFKRYEGDASETYFHGEGSGSKYFPLVYLVYNYKEGRLYPSDRPPMEGEIWGEENLSGFRFSLGLKLRVGRQN